MAEIWKRGRLAGIQYKDHETRRHGAVPDKFFRARYQVNGKRYMMNFGWSSEGWTEAKVFGKLQEFRHNAKTGEGPTSLKEERELKAREQEQAKAEEQEQKRRRITFQKFFEKTYRPQAESEKTWRTMMSENALYKKWLKPVIGKRALREVTSFDLERIKKKMADAGRAPRYIQYMLALVRQVHNQARRHGLVEGESPTADVKWPKFENRRTRFLSPEQAEELLTKLWEKSVDVQDQTLLSIDTGLRADEVFNLRWRDVDMENGFLRVRGEGAKSGKDRAVPVTARVKEMLQRRQEKVDDDNHLVFPDRNGNRIITISGDGSNQDNKLKYLY